MRRQCANVNCGTYFIANKNRRYCDDCSNLLDSNLNTIIMEGFEEEKDEDGVLKSKNIGYYLFENGTVYFRQTKFSTENPIKLQNSNLLKPVSVEFRRKILESPEEHYKENKNNNGIFLKNGKIYTQTKIDKKPPIEFHGKFLISPIEPSKEYDVYITGCIDCKKEFLSFANNAKYCPDCRSYKHNERNRKYRKKWLSPIHFTDDELLELNNRDINLKDRYFGRLGTSDFQPNRNPNEEEEQNKLEKN